MKNLVLLASLLVSANAFSKVDATSALNTIIGQGKYLGNGENGACTVTITYQANAAVVAIESNESSDVIAVLNSSNKYSYNEISKDFKASVTLNFPRYENGGTKFLSVKSVSNSVVFNLSNALFDHNGNDASTYLNCIISK